MEKTINIIENIITAISIVAIIWFILSWLEVVSKNCMPNPIYNPYNLFIILKNLV